MNVANFKMTRNYLLSGRGFIFIYKYRKNTVVWAVNLRYALYEIWTLVSWLYGGSCSGDVLVFVRYPPSRRISINSCMADGHFDKWIHKLQIKICINQIPVYIFAIGNSMRRTAGCILFKSFSDPTLYTELWRLNCTLMNNYGFANDRKNYILPKESSFCDRLS